MKPNRVERVRSLWRTTTGIEEMPFHKEIECDTDGERKCEADRHVTSSVCQLPRNPHS